MAGNPNGNFRRCRSCGCLAGKDGYCRNHRPEFKVSRFRDNFIDEKRGFTMPEEKEEFGVFRDFGIVGRWGDETTV